MKSDHRDGPAGHKNNYYYIIFNFLGFDINHTVTFPTSLEIHGISGMYLH